MPLASPVQAHQSAAAALYSARHVFQAISELWTRSLTSPSSRCYIQSDGAGTPECGCGFVFSPPEANAMLQAIDHAVHLFRCADDFDTILSYPFCPALCFVMARRSPMPCCRPSTTPCTPSGALTPSTHHFSTLLPGTVL